MTTVSKNCEASLRKLAKILDIPLKKGWKKDIADFFEIEQSLLSNWIKRGVSKEGLELAANKGYPQKIWYKDPNGYIEVAEKIGQNQENMRNPGAMTYALEPNYFNNFTGVKLYDQAVIKINVSHKPVVDKVVNILDSGETDTIEALKMNVDQFDWKIKEKQELRKAMASLKAIEKRQDEMGLLLNTQNKEIDMLKSELEREKNISNSSNPHLTGRVENE